MDDSGLDLQTATLAGATTLFGTLTAQSAMNNPNPNGTILNSSVAPVGNSAQPAQTVALPTWIWVAVIAGVLILIFKK